MADSAADLTPAGQPGGRAGEIPAAATAFRLLRAVPPRLFRVVLVAHNERRAALIAETLSCASRDLTVLSFPAWDCMPYDRPGPARDTMGTRIAAMRRLAEGVEGSFVLVTTAEALAQRVPPREQWSGAVLRLAVGDAFSPDALRAFLRRTGYLLDERVDEAGEAALRGAVIDIFPSGEAAPVRIDHSDGVVTGIRAYDPVSQRTLEDRSELLLAPASEVVLPECGPEAEATHFPGIEHFLPQQCDRLETLFDFAPDAVLAFEPGAESRYERFWAQVEDAFATRRAAPNGHGRASPAPAQLYLEPSEWQDRIAAAEHLPFDLDGVGRVPEEVGQQRQALASLVAEQLAGGATILLAAADEGDRDRMARRIGRIADKVVQPAGDWSAVVDAEAGSPVSLAVEIDTGFIDRREKLVVLGRREVLGVASHAGGQSDALADLGLAAADLRLGDRVVHLDHGLAVLKGIETVSPSGGSAEDALVLEFADDAKLLVPAAEIGRIWRYGSAADTVPLDRLGGETWANRRAALEADLAETAENLVDLARQRARARAEPIIPPRAAYERFSAGFPFSETPDQAQAIADMLGDLASGRPMNRLVCGDVGFGKTEVALRAVAAAALSGLQAAVVAPTTVLVRQHVQTFRRRFARSGLEVAHLSRLVKPAEAREVKAGLASGDVRIVIGTHALAGKGVRFKELGLLVIDEEQRFGQKQKEKLRALGQNIHVLTTTATPIPRTLEWAKLGLQDLSVIATPPARRQPVRTFLTPFDPVSVRAALLRERQRGGQSFVVCPRIEDLEPMAARLAELVPELKVVTAHGKLPAEEMDMVMVDFADGVGDVLLATNIIESGLDVPRANTILVWRADRFGLAQLHQLRGRVGRGRARGVAYLLTDPAAKIAKSTEQRLRTLEAMDRLGAGFAISGRDLDLRGAGDLLGEEQAGHMKLIGLGLYRHLLGCALAVARGAVPEEEWTPTIRLGLDAAVPEEYIPEADLRIDLHARLASLAEEDDPEDLADEIADRFGPLPEPVANLVVLAHLRRLARRLGIEKLDVGPDALAATFREGAALSAAAHIRNAPAKMEWRGDRLVWARRSGSAEERRKLAAQFLKMLAGRPAKRVRRPAPQPA